MRFPQFFIERPIFATVLSVLITLVGAITYVTLPVAQYPAITPPTIQVQASYPGASPDVLANTVVTPLEQEINGVEGMIYMTSSSTSNGAATITVTFEQGTDPDTAQVLVQNRVARAEPQLPELVRRTGVTTEKASEDLLMVAHVISPDGSRDQLFIGNYAFLRIRNELQRLDGVGDVTVFGAAEYSMRVWLNPQQLSARNLTTGDVLRSLREQNVQVAAGTVAEQPLEAPAAFQMTMKAEGRLKTAGEFGDIVLETGEQGEVVQLSDVSRIELGAQDYARESYLDGEPAIGLGVSAKPGANALATVEEIKSKLAELSRDFPSGMDYTIVYNPTVFVEESIEAVYHTLFEAVLLVVLVVLLFLQNWRAALIPLLAIPVSLVGTFALMAPLGFSLNSLTLFGLVLAIGIVVDDAIVVVENVERHLEEGMGPKEASQKAMAEISSALLSLGLVLVAVFLPAAFIGGISGQFYQQFAITIATATMISVLVSLTLSPALCAIFLRRRDANRDGLQRVIDLLLGWFFRGFNKAFGWFSRGYGGVIGRVTRKVALMLLLYLGLLGVGGYLFQKTPGGFIPQQDQGYLIVSIQLPEAASLSRTREVLMDVGEIARDVEGITHSVDIAGFSGATRAIASNAAAVFVLLDSFEKRDETGRSAEVIVRELQQKMATVTDAQVVVIEPPPVRGVGTGGGFKLMLQDRGGGGYAELQRTANEFIGKLNQEPSVGRAFTTYSATTPQFFADIDRIKAKKLDVPMGNVFETLQTFFGSSYVNDFNQFGRTYRVIAQADAPYRDSASDVRYFKTRSENGAIVPLSAVMEMKRVTGPDRVVRHNLYPTAEISGQSAPGFSSGETLDAVERVAAELPPGYGQEWVEIAYQQRAAGNTALVVFLLAVVFVFLLLAAQYESWGMPMAVILIMPMCLFGAITGILLRGLDNNILSQIGFVVLIGLAAKNAILIVEFARQQAAKGLDRFEAAREACRLRLRAIMMTSMAFILGVVPLVFASGPGYEMRQALGTAVFAGMLGVTFFGLLFTPVFYVFVQGIAERRKGERGSDGGEQLEPGSC